jgi:hypothetical protein
MTEYKKVSMTEFDLFISNYKNKLETNVVSFFDPAALCYHDFKIGKEWDSIIAYVSLDDEREYFIKEGQG